MLYLLYTHMERCTDTEVQRLLSEVSPQRREEAMRFSYTFGRFCCLKSYCMLETLLGAVSPSLDYTRPDFVRGADGKPSLSPEWQAKTGIYFNISHTKNAILVAVDGRPIGVDVEQIRHPSQALIARTMNEAEQLEIAAAHDPDAAFTAFWTQKEAVLKLRGTGIRDDLRDVLPAPDAVLTTEVCREKGFAMTIATFREK